MMVEIGIAENVWHDAWCGNCGYTWKTLGGLEVPKHSCEMENLKSRVSELEEIVQDLIKVRKVSK